MSANILLIYANFFKLYIFVKKLYNFYGGIDGANKKIGVNDS